MGGAATAQPRSGDSPQRASRDSLPAAAPRVLPSVRRAPARPAPRQQHTHFATPISVGSGVRPVIMRHDRGACHKPPAHVIPAGGTISTLPHHSPSPVSHPTPTRQAPDGTADRCSLFQILKPPPCRLCRFDVRFLILTYSPFTLSQSSPGGSEHRQTGTHFRRHRPGIVSRDRGSATATRRR
jgi:hypothetical protein